MYVTRGEIDTACGSGFAIRGLGIFSLLLAAAAVALL